MQNSKFPSGLKAVGISEKDISPLAERAFPQQRVINNCPVPVQADNLREIYRGALNYW